MPSTRLHDGHAATSAVLLIAVIFLGATTATELRAENFCVSTAAELRNAFSIASANGQDDTVRVAQGVYLTAGQGFSYSTAENFAFVLLGGYTAGCADRELDPTNTILDGENTTQAMRIFPGNDTSGDLLVEGFTFRNGYLTGTSSGAGLAIGGSAGYSGTVVVTHNIFTGNHSEFFGSGLYGGSDTGLTQITGNLIVNNSTDQQQAASLTSNGVAIITNNTVAANTSAQGTAGLRLGGIGGLASSMSNNIIYGNTGNDLALDASDVLLLNNDIGSQTGVGGAGSTGNVSVDPQFIGAGDFHLLSYSSVVNAGTNVPPGGLPATDLDGLARIYDGTVDMGAYEYSGQPDAVELVAVAAEPRPGAVLLTWQTGVESQHAGFHVRRARTGLNPGSVSAGSAARVTAELIVAPSPYVFLDSGVEPRVLYDYWLEAIDLWGRSEFFGPVTANADPPATVPPADGAVRAESWPNPWSAATPVAEIRFELPAASHVSLGIFDASGRLVRRLADGPFTSGSHLASWDGRGERGVTVRSGVYFYRLVVGEAVVTGRLVRYR